MAKKKAAVAPRNGAAAKTTAKKPKPVPATALTNDVIGDTAGKVWHALAEGPRTLAALKKSIEKPEGPGPAKAPAKKPAARKGSADKAKPAPAKPAAGTRKRA